MRFDSSVYGGRNWEGFGPDPYFAGEAVTETVIGMQSQGVGANVKHFFGSESRSFRYFFRRVRFQVAESPPLN